MLYSLYSGENCIPLVPVSYNSAVNDLQVMLYSLYSGENCIGLGPESYTSAVNDLCCTVCILHWEVVQWEIWIHFPEENQLMDPAVTPNFHSFQLRPSCAAHPN